MEVDWQTYLDIAVEQRLRSQKGDAFQTFFGAVMEALNKDFIRIQSYGSRGDEGVDGYFFDGKKVHQCYGAQNGHINRVDAVCRKVRDDFDTILLKHSDIKEWIFTHNVVDGLAMDILNTINEMKRIGKEKGIEVSIYRPLDMRRDVDRLAAEDQRRLLGVQAFDVSKRERLPFALNAIVSGLMDKIDSMVVPASPPKPVPLEKFELNYIPNGWKRWLTQALTEAPLAIDAIATYGDSKAAELVPHFFKERYLEVKLAGGSPGQILHELHTMLVGSVRTLDDDSDIQFAGHVMLAAMFEACEIFEDKKEVAFAGTEA